MTSITRSIEVPGARLALELVGPEDGLPVLLLHGFPLTRHMWDPQIEALGDRFRLLVPDLRGMGESLDDGFPRTFERYVDDALAVLDAEGIASAVVVGLSMGGYVALRLRERAPDRVRALVLADTRSQPDDDPGRLKRAAGVARLQEGDVEGFARGFAGGVLHEPTDELVERVVGMTVGNPPAGMAAALVAMATRTDTTPGLGDIDAPTLVIVGEEDRLTPPEVAEALAGAIPGARLERIAGAGHLSNLEVPTAFDRVLGKFLDAVGDP
jgi:pimeloyl-ACP methyl ester carboxylesterase